MVKQNSVETLTPPGTMEPIGPYSHIARAGPILMIGAVAGVDPATGELVGPDIASQTTQILTAFETMLGAVDVGFGDVLHINVFLIDMADFQQMNAAYAHKMGSWRPARTAIAVAGLPKPGARITMNLTAASPTLAR
jgi:2-iminobutanoate/2-iminopropanoate deaminase